MSLSRRFIPLLVGFLHTRPLWELQSLWIPKREKYFHHASKTEKNIFCKRWNMFAEICWVKESTWCSVCRPRIRRLQPIYIHQSSQMRSHDLISRWPRPVARECSQFTFTKMQYDCDIVRNPCANMGDIEILRIEKQENLPNEMVSSHISQAFI